MKNSNSISIKLLLALGIIALVPNLASAQTIQPAVRITQPVDAAKLAVLHGNTHPLARAEFDRGPAPASLSLDHMQLVLTRSPQQDAALNTLLAEQQDTNSPNYHKWLTPDEFGQQFGASDADIQTITAWLQSNGFQIDEVAKGKNIIEFSGNAGQVQAAFHTAIHKYVFASGEEHWANSSDPQIPAALATVVAGVNTLHNFPKHRASHTMPLRARANSSARTQSPAPDVTIVGGACEGSGTNCYLVGPADFATIYNVAPLYAAGIDGTGQTIGIVSDSDININDANAYRTTFSLPANPPVIIHNGTAPGVQMCEAGGDECEAILDVEIAGGVAKGATIDLVVSPSSTVAFGGDLSATYIINTLSSSVGVLSYSYGACELDLGTAGNSFYNTLWSQAATEGITVVVSTGDTGSANCEFPDASLFIPEPATTGLSVNGIASTPFNVAVGGTDFNDLENPTTYFSATNSTGINSAIGYIPETTYNDSCTNALIYNAPNVNGLPFWIWGTFGTAEAACNSSQLFSAANGFDFVLPSGGGGGASNCTTSSTVTQVVNGIPTTITDGQVSSCIGGYAKPSFQTGLTPADGKRDLPDVSLFSGDGTIQNFYVTCEADEFQPPVFCNASNAAATFSGGGGTSAAVQAFAGVVALLNHATGVLHQGNINAALYPIAAKQITAGTNCNSSNNPIVASCAFYDITAGTTSMPCALNSTNCTVNDLGDQIGLLGTAGLQNGFTATAGYDEATGLGSVNVNNLANALPNFSFSATGPVVIVPAPGMSGSSTFTVQATNGFTGTVTFACTNLPTGGTCVFTPPSEAFTALNTSFTVGIMVNTTSASNVGPAVRLTQPGPWTPTARLTLLGALCAAIVLASLLRKQRGWKTAFATTAFALLILSVGCGGGSSTSGGGGGGGGGGSSTSPTITGTATNGAVHSVKFTLTIN